MENLERQIEKTYRVNYRQTAGGKWYADFTVRADGINELSDKTDQVQQEVIARLAVLNQNGLGGEKE